MDELSKMHYKTVRAEIEGRFFSEEEGKQLKEAIERRIITDPATRALAAKTWEGMDEGSYRKRVGEWG